MPTSIPPSKREETEPDERVVDEIYRLVAPARWGHRDATMILVAYRHGLRVSELVVSGGINSTSPMPSCTSEGPRKAPRRPIQFPATKCVI